MDVRLRKQDGEWDKIQNGDRVRSATWEDSEHKTNDKKNVFRLF